VKGHFLHDRVELLQLQAFRSVLLVLGCDIPAGPGEPAVLVLGAFQYHLYPTAFFCHSWTILDAASGAVLLFKSFLLLLSIS